MKFKNVRLLVISLVLVMSLMPTPAWAVQAKDAFSFNTGITITPNWANTLSARASISKSNKVLTPSVYVQATSSSTRISGTLYLEIKSGSKWLEETSWSVSGTGTLSVSKTYTGTVGETYRARAVVDVGGEPIECISAECKI